jgi:hypothetical protein
LSIIKSIIKLCQLFKNQITWHYSLKESFHRSQNLLVVSSRLLKYFAGNGSHILGSNLLRF